MTQASGRVRTVESRSTQQRRLEATLDAFRPKFDQLLQGVAPDATWAMTARGLFDRASDAAARRRVDSAWLLFHAARREVTSGQPRAEMNAAAVALREEAIEKLAGWRREAVQQLLSQFDRADEVDARPRMQQAMQIRDEKLENDYVKAALAAERIRFFSSTAVLLLGAIGLALLLLGFPSAPLAQIDQRQLVPFVLLLGAMGGTLSALRASAPSEVRIPAQLAGLPALVARPTVGAATALVLYFFFTSELSPVRPAATQTLLFLSLVAGVSERIFDAAISRGERG